MSSRAPFLREICIDILQTNVDAFPFMWCINALAAAGWNPKSFQHISSNN